MSPRTNPSPKASELRDLREKAGLSQSDLARELGYAEKTVARWERGEVPVRVGAIRFLRALPANLPATPQVYDGPGFRFVDLFAGIGGFRKGFESIGGHCVFTSEWDQKAQLTYRENYGEQDIQGDITKIPSARIPEHDVLVAGFPCQPFSIAGVSKKNSLGRAHGFDCDTQGTLFFELERIVRDHQPKAFLFENVKNLKSHDGGKTWTVIEHVLKKKLKYRIFPMIVDAKPLVPQHRERIFIVGFREDADFSWDDLLIPPVNEGPRLSSILHPVDGSGLAEERFTDKNGKALKKYVLSDHLWTYLQNYAAKHQAQGNGFGFGLVGPNDTARTLSARYYKDGSEILVKRGRGNPRRLTPRECARLMGFDRPGQQPFRIPVSDTQAYKQFGNAVVVPVVEAIARAMRPHILGETVTREQLALELRSA